MSSVCNNDDGCPSLPPNQTFSVRHIRSGIKDEDGLPECSACNSKTRTGFAKVPAEALVFAEKNPPTPLDIPLCEDISLCLSVSG